MTDLSLARLVETMNAELGLSIAFRAPASLSTPGLPPALAEFYEITDGLDLPFLRLFPVHEMLRQSPLEINQERWIHFGGDEPLMLCLCRWSQDRNSPSLAVWNREGGQDVEPAYSRIPPMLLDLYERYVLDTGKTAWVRINAVPEQISPASVLLQLKRITRLPSRELGSFMRSLPEDLGTVDCATAIDVVRKLQGLGVSCHLNRVGPIDAA